MHEVSVHEIDDNLGGLGLRLQRIAEPNLDILVVAEPSGYGKHHGEYRHNGKQGGVGEGCGFAHHALGGEQAHREYAPLGRLDGQTLPHRGVGLRLLPYSAAQKPDR